MEKSIVVSATYNPSENIKRLNHLVVTLDGKPLIGLGEYEDINSHIEAEKLFQSSSFRLLVDAYCGFKSDSLSLRKIHGNNIDWKEQEFCISKNNENQDLHWIVFGNNAKSLSLAIAMDNKIIDTMHLGKKINTLNESILNDDNANSDTKTVKLRIKR